MCGVRAYVNIFQNGQCSVTENYICDMLLSMGCTEELHQKTKVSHTCMYHMVSRTHPGPKEPMHAFLEGRTRHLSAQTCFMFVHTGLCTAVQLQNRAATFDWTPGGASLASLCPHTHTTRNSYQVMLRRRESFYRDARVA